MKSNRVILIVLTGIILSSCSHVGSMVLQTPPDIIIHVNNSGAAGITTPGMASCKVKNQGKNGCIHISQNDKGLITFKRTGPPGWTLKTFEICKILNDGSKVCSLNIWERMEFAVTNSAGDKMLIPNSSGRVNLTDISPSLDTFILLDQNTTAQEYYYQVEVCDADTCTWADPPLENGGRN